MKTTLPPIQPKLETLHYTLLGVMGFMLLNLIVAATLGKVELVSSFGVWLGVFTAFFCGILTGQRLENDRLRERLDQTQAS